MDRRVHRALSGEARLVPGSIRRSGGSRPGSRISTTSLRSALLGSSGGFTKTLATPWRMASRRHSPRLAGLRPSSLHQTRVFSEVVSERPKPVAYFLVDAMRFEMGVELSERLPKTSEVSVRHAVGALPSITPIGMAALQPAASGSFSVIEQGGKLGARIEDAFLPDLASRKKLAAARVPKLVDLTLDELLGLQPSKLSRKLDGAQVVVVRSQEIDRAGETGFTFQARQVMDTVIDNLARAISNLPRGRRTRGGEC